MTLKKKILVALILLFIIAQFFSPKKNQSGSYAINKFIVETKAPMEVQKILTQACFDCHPNMASEHFSNARPRTG